MYITTVQQRRISSYGVWSKDAFLESALNSLNFFIFHCSSLVKFTYFAVSKTKLLLGTFSDYCLNKFSEEFFFAKLKKQSYIVYHCNFVNVVDAQLSAMTITKLLFSLSVVGLNGNFFFGIFISFLLPLDGSICWHLKIMEIKKNYTASWFKKYFEPGRVVFGLKPSVRV